MSHRRDTRTDVVHVIPTNDPPPESPYKKTRGSPSSSSSEIIKPFFKTKLCCNFRTGNCPYATSICHFAHSVEELRLPTAAETRGEFKMPAESGRPYKGRHCKFYGGEGGCPYGERCTFLHDEGSRDRERFAISLGSRGGCGAGDVVALNWKTRMCNKWEMSGFCPFGTNCLFAHGASELHRFGGGLVEEDGKIRASSTLDTKKTGLADTVSSLVSHGVPSQRASNAVTQKPNGVRVLRKWKGPDKISRVYGDWIDDIE
ncbi:unnamed protein product [Eruca vesicaria subsp. sativa]|uniref:C3H1-type domain-containing protein n=1 Tax=Eruca vesicaria subsp. sativa TaxID=29727 RepID=A0ABC8KQ36_ERUVS|nr:unnamed protein product [Eruca vesicaria subsp. sativa]